MPGLSDLIAPVEPTALPTLSPPPTFTDPANFDDRADTHVAQMVAQVPLLNTENAKVSQNANAAYIAAQVAVPAATLAVEAANTALNAPGVMATSSTNLELTAGVKDLVLDQIGKTFGKGQTVVLASTANPLLQAAAIVLNNVPGTGALQLSIGQPTGAGTFASWTISVGAPTAPLPRFTYGNRGQLRTFVAIAGAGATVEGLGLFVYVPGSSEPDDDESCFATGTGRWLLEAVSYDLVNAWMAPILEQIPANVVGAIYGYGNCAITIVSANSQASFNILVDGAELNDRVLAAPPIAMTYQMSFLARVTSSGVVTIYLNNANPNSLSAAGPVGIWYVTVFKEST